jgi:hypothetical protein
MGEGNVQWRQFGGYDAEVHEVDVTAIIAVLVEILSYTDVAVEMDNLAALHYLRPMYGYVDGRTAT